MYLGKELENIGEVSTSNLVEATDKLIHIYGLLKRGRYGEAKHVLEGYLIEKAKDGEEMKGDLLNVDVGVPTAAAEKLSKTIDRQIKSIVDCLK